MSSGITCIASAKSLPECAASAHDARDMHSARRFDCQSNLQGPADNKAIKRGVRVTVCKSNNQATCTAGAQWEDGWIVFSDPDNDGTYDNAPEEIILVSTGLEGSNTLRTGGNFSNFVSYISSGESRGSPGNNDTFNLCDDRGAAKGRAIRVSLTGRIRTEKGAVACP